nr:ion transporter [Actinocorallia populi]
MPGRARVRTLVESRRFQRFVTAVILVNAATLGCETSPYLLAEYGGLLHAVDRIALGVFTVELALRLHVYRRRFFSDAWNWFDLVIVVMALLPSGGGLSVLRSLRILRALRLVSMIPSMRRVVSALLSALPGMASITGLLALILYVAAVMATKLFAATDPEHFGDLGASAFTLFQIMTADGWSEIARGVMAEQPFAWIFFVLYILASTFVVLNLFIAITVSAMEPQVVGEIHEDLERLDEREQRTDTLVLSELRALRAEVEALRARIPDAAAGGRTAPEPEGRTDALPA